MALFLANAEYEHREVLLRDKPDHMLEMSPKGSVPVLILSDGTILDESMDIMRWALPNVQIPYEITGMIDGPFKHHLDRYKYASRYDETAKRGDVDLAHRARAIAALNVLDEMLETAPFLSGLELGPNDIASFPFVRQFAAVEPDWWAETEDITHIQGWLKTCVESELFKAIMVKYPVWAPTH